MKFEVYRIKVKLEEVYCGIYKKLIYLLIILGVVNEHNVANEEGSI